MRIIGISGSLRKKSLNTALLQAAAGLAPSDVKIEIHSIRDIPLYDGDVEAQGTPETVEKLKDVLRGADGLLIATPEYNHAMPGVLKNTIDWLSRRIDDGKPMVFPGLPVGIMGASPGGLGTALSQASWLEVFRVMGADLFTGSTLTLGRAMTLFDDAGAIGDEKTRARVEKYLGQFAAFVSQQRVTTS